MKYKEYLYIFLEFAIILLISYNALSLGYKLAIFHFILRVLKVLCSVRNCN